MSPTVGTRDERGSLLILGGRIENLWKLKNYLYAVGETLTASEEEAVKAYNEANGTNLSLDYIQKVFIPWYNKQVESIEVPSRSETGISYTVTRELDGTLTYTCKGFIYRHDCWHVQAVEELVSGQSNSYS